jgi:ubiquinone/menaquinone biosynthesis C-methylase UbiE
MGAEKVGRRYRGKGAAEYEAKRAHKQKWILENQGVEYLFPDNIKAVLDVPVGTGRFKYLYEKKSIEKIVGVDTSPDMLKEAKKKGITNLYLNDIRKMPFKNKAFDLAICIRLFPWFA